MPDRISVYAIRPLRPSQVLFIVAHNGPASALTLYGAGQYLTAKYIISAVNTLVSDSNRRRIDTFINSLKSPNLELIAPLPVTLEYEDGEFIAEVNGTNIAMSGDSATEALDLLRDHITATLKFYQAERKLGPIPQRQKQLLEQYVGEPDPKTRSRRNRRKTPS